MCIFTLLQLMLAVCHVQCEMQPDVDTSGDLTAFTTEFPSFYHTSDHVRTLLSELANPESSQACDGAKLIRTSVQGCAGNCSREQQAADNVFDALLIRRGDGQKKNRLAIAFGEHGRELITTELAVHLLKAICPKKHDARSSLVEGAGAGGEMASSALQQRAEALLANTEFLIMPNVDENGRKRAEQGKPCSSRSNENDVDLNRNWDYHWEQDAGLLRKEGTTGSKPFSEPEVRIMRDRLAEFKPTGFLSVHSGARGVYLPGAYSKDPSEAKATIGESWDPMMHIANNINDMTRCNCRVGPAGQVANKDHPGTSLDYVGLEMKVPFSMAWEVWLENSNDCMKHFSPLDANKYRSVLDKWTNSMLYYAEAVDGFGGRNGSEVRPSPSSNSMLQAAKKEPKRTLRRHGRD